MKCLCVTKNDHVYKLHRKTKFEIYAMFEELFDRETIRWAGDGYICCNLKWGEKCISGSSHIDHRSETVEKNSIVHMIPSNMFTCRSVEVT